MSSAGTNLNSLGVLSTVRTVRVTQPDGSTTTTEYFSDGSKLVTEGPPSVAAAPPPEGASAPVSDQHQNDEPPMEDEPCAQAQNSGIADEENPGEVVNKPNTETNGSGKDNTLRCGKYSVTKELIPRLRLAGLLYDILSDTYILFFSGIPEEVENVIIGPWVLDILILILTLCNWKSVVAENEPGLIFNIASFLGLIWADVTEFTVSLRYMSSCGIQALLAVKAAKFIPIFPVETKSFWTLYMKQQREMAGPDAITPGKKCAIIGLFMLVSLGFGVFVPLVNMNTVEEERGRSELCSLFG